MKSSFTVVKEKHYATECAILLTQCRSTLSNIIQYQQEEGPDGTRSSNLHILDLDRALLAIEQLLHYHLLTLIERECQQNKDTPQHTVITTIATTQQNQDMKNNDGNRSLLETVDTLKDILKQKKQAGSSFHKNNHNVPHQQANRWQTSSSTRKKNNVLLEHGLEEERSTSYEALHLNMHPFSTTGEATSSSRNISNITPINNKNITLPNNPNRISSTSHMDKKNSTRSVLDSLLFRLIVILQLCHVRIEESYSIICGQKNAKNVGFTMIPTVMSATSNDSAESEQQQEHRQARRKRAGRKRMLIFGAAVTFLTTSSLFIKEDTEPKKEGVKSYHDVAHVGSKAITATGIMVLMRRGWRILCMNARLFNSILALEDWQQCWMLVQSVGVDDSLKLHGVGDSDGSENEVCNTSRSEEQCRRLLELMSLQGSKSSMWDSQGSFRYGMIQYGMGIFYATTMEVSKAKRIKNNIFLMPIAAAAASVYYAVVGPGNKSVEMLSSDKGSSDLMQNAWGIVSLPAVKEISLQASRLLKGAAIAERIVICGVPCFVLSKHTNPTLSAAIRRYRRHKKRDLHTILESTSYHGPSSHVRSSLHPLGDYPKINVIFHLTGGGFFAHTIAGDVPYLMDWSDVTKAVCIVPEYALLPEHCFPVAIDQITNVYTSLVRGDLAPLLGFQTDQIIVSGESTGGNLGAALCVKLCLEKEKDIELAASTQYHTDSSSLSGTSSNDNELGPLARHSSIINSVRLPSGLMLCCPALDLSLDISPSRVIGAHDAVLPSALISTISDAYVPEHVTSKKNPVVSPACAPDEILAQFPTTLIYASSEDPLLDDSVLFHARLRDLGVSSDLRAVQHLPHAYWGLGTAGFPDVRQVQRECQEWMIAQFNQSEVSKR